MNRIKIVLVATSLVALTGHTFLWAEDNKSAGAGVKADSDVVDPPQADWAEPRAKEFSLKKAAAYLDDVSVHWTRAEKCAACHTNVAYLMARPVLSKLYPHNDEVRDAFELWSEKWDELIYPGGRIPAMAVTLASTLAINDSMTSGKLHPTTRRAFDRMWEMQRADGGWDWRVADAPPMKSDEHYGATFAAVAVGMAPEDYIDTPQAKKGVERIRKYLASHPPHSLHHRAMIAWASLYVDDLMTANERKQVVARLLDLQRSDGGWSADRLFGDWQGWDLDDDELDSDGYGTGFAIYIARINGIPKTDQRIQHGVQWIKENQKQSGRWFTASIGPENPYGENRIATAGTAMVLLALDACGEIPKR